MSNLYTALFVGCGGISRAWLEPLEALPEIKLVALVDLDEAVAKQRAQEFNLEVETSTDLTEMLAKHKPDIVFDATIPSAHYNVTLAALEQGCHVLGEKPMADNLEQASTMVAAAEKTQKLYVVMQNWRYTHNIRRLKRFLDEGHLGDITTLNADFYIGAHFGGFRDEMEHVLVKDMAIHTFDAARFLSDQQPKKVYCKEWNPKGSHYAHHAAASAIFDMTNDVVFNYRGSWCAEGLNTPWECAWHIVGTRGSLRWDGDKEMICQVIAREGQSTFRYDLNDIKVPDIDTHGKNEGHAAVLDSFLAALTTGSSPETLCTDNIHSLAMVYGAIESSDKNKPISIQLETSLKEVV